MQVNYVMKLVYSVDYIGLDRVVGEIKAACPDDIDVQIMNPRTEPQRIPRWTSLIFSRQFGSPEALEALVNMAVARAGLADRLKPA